MRLASSSWSGQDQLNGTFSGWQTFQSLAPSVAALTGQVAGVPTAGLVWPSVGVVQVSYMLGALAIRVTVGGVDAPIVVPSNGTVLTPEGAVAVVLATRTPAGLVSISFNLPPGQGSSNALQVS